MTASRLLTRTPALALRRSALAAALAAAFAAQASQHLADATALSLEQLLEVTVVGAAKYEQKQSEAAAAVSVITRNEIKAFGWRTLDQALASLPGVHTTYDRQYTYLGLRGFGLPGDYNTRVLVTVNGNRINEPTYDGGPFGSQLPLDMDLVERIEFIPGPGGAVYGQNAMFGVVNIVTREGSDLAGHAEAALAWKDPQALREGRLTWGRRLDNGVSVLLSASALRMRGEDLRLDFGDAGVSGVARRLDGERDKEFLLRASRGIWSFDFVYGDRRKDDPTGAFFSDPLVPGQYERDAYAVAQLMLRDSFADNQLDLSARLFAGHNRYRSELSYEGGFYSYPADSRWRGLELRALYTGMRDHKLMLGLEAQDDVQRDQAALDLSDPANNILMPGAGYRYGVYAQDEWRIAESLVATLGLRVDRNDSTGTQKSPRAALIWQANADTTLKALYGRAHRAPNAYERDYDDGQALVGNPMLAGERIDTFELVADRRVGRELALRASAYRWSMKNLIALGIDPTSGLPQYQSGEPVDAKGLELAADRTWSNGARLRGNLSLQRVSSGGGDLPNSPRRLVKVNLSGPLPWAGLRAGLEWRWESSRLTLDGSRLGGRALADLNLGTESLAPGLELSLKIANLHDKRYAHPGADTNWQNAITQDGRSARLQVSYRF
jgi:iron complex outermembrane receptor protein